MKKTSIKHGMKIMIAVKIKNPLFPETDGEQEVLSFNSKSSAIVYFLKRKVPKLIICNTLKCTYQHIHITEKQNIINGKLPKNGN
jgi:hypothetical protein